MGKGARKKRIPEQPLVATHGRRIWLPVLLTGSLLLVGIAVIVLRHSAVTPPVKSTPAVPPAAASTPPPQEMVPPQAPPTVPNSVPAAATDVAPELYRMDINDSVMVVVDLDYGAHVPSVAQALNDVERNYGPDDGIGRTFAILDAHTQPAPPGKLVLAMHLASEKAGLGELVFRPTERVLWRAQFGPAVKPPKGFAGKNLFIMVDDGQGHLQLVDGSKGARTVFDCPLLSVSRALTVGDIWPDGAEREVTYFYSTCGCPVKVKLRRSGGHSAPIGEMPVIFPDDPAVVTVIAKLMGW